ncbi:unnamed protein product, partial [Rotaria socialis]
RVQLRQCYELMDENTFKSYGISGKFREPRTTSFKKIIQITLHDDHLFTYGEFIQCVKWVLVEKKSRYS